MINVVIFNHRRKYTKPGTLALRIVKDKKIESCHTWRRGLYQIFNQKKNNIQKEDFKLSKEEKQ